MKTTPLHHDFGIEVQGIDLGAITREFGYAEIRDLFERHSLLLFRGQSLDDKQHLALGRLFGPLENRKDTPAVDISPVSNVTEDGGLTAERDRHTLHLISNQLWHTDSTFLPVPALANILRACVLPSHGGETELVSTRAGWRRLDPTLQARLRGAFFHHRYAHSRAKIDAELAREALFTKWVDQTWRAVWSNPVTGEEALYIASHAFAVEGMEEEAGLALIDELIAAMTPDDAVYSHAWRAGDVLIWDERATLHRGRPWPYDEARRLMSICVSAGESDGLDRVRPV